MTRQISVAESWKRTYEAFQDINFTGFDFYSVKSSLIDYLKLHYSENFNDYIESSELITIIETFAYISEVLAYRFDMNAHENVISLAERKQNVLQLAKLVSYSASRNVPLRGLVKITQVSTSETIFDSNGINLSGRTILWNDANNVNWKEQFLLVINDILEQPFGSVLPKDRVQVDDVVFESYSLKTTSLTKNVIPFNASINSRNVKFEMVSAALNENGPYEARPSRQTSFNILYVTDGIGDSSDNTGFFVYFKQGTLQRITQNYDGITPNQNTIIGIENINETDVWVNQIDPETGDILKNRNVDLLGRNLGYAGEWIAVDNSTTNNILYNNLPNRNKYEIETLDLDKIRIIFGDGEYAEIPSGPFDIWIRTSENETLVLPKSQIVNKKASISYSNVFGVNNSFSFGFSLMSSVANSTSSEDIESIRKIAPAVYYTQDRMVTGQDYNTYMLQDPSILKLKTVNRTFAGDSKYITWHDPSDTYEDVKMVGRDLRLFFKNDTTQLDIPVNSSYSTVIRNILQPILSYSAVQTYHEKNNIPTNRVVFTLQEINNLTADLTNINIADVPLQIAYIDQTTKAYQSIVFTMDAIGNDINNGTIAELDPDIVVKLTIDDLGEQTVNITPSAIRDPGGVITLESLAVELNTKLNLLSPAADAFVYKNSIVIRSKLSGTLSNISMNISFFNNLTSSLNYFSHICDTVKFSNTALWRGYSIKVPLLSAHTFEVNPLVSNVRTVYWDAIYNSLQLTAESDSTTFWNTNKKQTIINNDTLTPVKDKLIILSANLTSKKDNVLQADIPLNVNGQDIQNTNENLGMYYLNRLLLETEDVNEDSVPDDKHLTALLDTTYTVSDIPAPTSNPGYNTFAIPTSYFVGYDEVEVYDGTTKLTKGVDYIESDNLGVEAVVGTTSTFISIDSTLYPSYSGIKFVYIDYLYYKLYGADLFNYVPLEDNAIEILIKNEWYASSVDFVSSPTVVRYRGRDNLNFMWLYVTPYGNLINPAPTNIHDMFIITRGYYQQLQLWLSNITLKPVEPTPYELRNTYGKLLQSKMRSDHVVLHTGKVKLIFGKKAVPQLQAKIKIVKDSNSKLSDNDVKVKVVAIIKDFFDINYWEFGESFSFSELSAVIHGRLTSDIQSIVLVPTLSTNKFGDMYEIFASDEEILQPDISVDDIEMISALTSVTLKQKM